MERILPPGTDCFERPLNLADELARLGHVIPKLFGGHFSTEERRAESAGLTMGNGDGPANVVYSGKGRQRIHRLLDEIRLPSVMYR